MEGCGLIKREFSSSEKFYNSSVIKDLIKSGTTNTSSIIGTCFFGDGDLNEALNIKDNLNDIN